MKKKILVTGGTGYIGSHTVVELQQSGYDVVIIDNSSNSTIGIVNSIAEITNQKPEFYQFDLCDKEKLKNFFTENKNIDGIIHFAAYKAVGESVEKPLKYYKNNIFSLVNILECMTEFNINNFVFSSSCTVYGQPKELPVTENSPIQKAFSPYGNTKKIAEDIIIDSSKIYKINSILLRYFNPIGAHETAIIGELPNGVPNNLVPFITQTAIGKREKLKVFGNDYNTKDGTAIRDYIHVVDLAKAHVVAVERLLNNKLIEVEIFNVGTGEGYSVLEIINTFERVSGLKLKYEFTERRAGDIEKVWANTDLANNVLKWKARKTLDNMLESAWKWEQNLKNK